MDRDRELRDKIQKYIQHTKLGLKYLDKNKNPKKEGIQEKIELNIGFTGTKKEMYNELNTLIKKIHENTRYSVNKPEIYLGGNDFFMELTETPSEEKFTIGDIDINLYLEY